MQREVCLPVCGLSQKKMPSVAQPTESGSQSGWLLLHGCDWVTPITESEVQQRAITRTTCVQKYFRIHSPLESGVAKDTEKKIFLYPAKRWWGGGGVGLGWVRAPWDVLALCLPLNCGIDGIPSGHHPAMMMLFSIRFRILEMMMMMMMLAHVLPRIASGYFYWSGRQAPAKRRVPQSLFFFSSWLNVCQIFHVDYFCESKM